VADAETELEALRSTLRAQIVRLEEQAEEIARSYGTASVQYADVCAALTRLEAEYEGLA
jgi:histone H3/H4